jgi:hypothetical protein
MPGRVGKRFKLAWESHYPGDVRSLHNDLLESYQLKAGDALVLLPFEEALRYWHGTHGRTAARQPLGRWVAQGGAKDTTDDPAECVACAVLMAFDGRTCEREQGPPQRAPHELGIG